ncbi:MAG: hypothetical protein ACP59X_12165 [Solidesulfovibrio sp. DCME]|uniref:hypothetical protein n=1 Tax=Solidesulfovibrio sp. DCME TaxID=3447380 RepID=UPI003D10955F
MGLRLACTTKKDERPKGGETWLPLSFGLMDLALALRKAGFLEGFVEKAVLVFIRANPLDLR